MSLIPFILDLADELHEFSRCLASGIDINDFGFGLYTGLDPQNQQPQQQQQQQQHQSPRRSRTSSFSSLWMPSKRHHPYNRIKTACCAKTTNVSAEDAVANPSNPDVATSSPGKSASYSVVNKNGFQVSMNVKQFAPNELSVKTIDNCIVVEGRHDDKEDGHGVISRHFVRKYMLPKGYDPNDVLSTLSSDGILTVKAPPPPPPAMKNDASNERIIEIQPTPGPTPVMVVTSSATAKETSQMKEQQTKKTTLPPTRLECQLPEKRQKLDLPNEQVMTETQPPLSTAAAEDTETASAEATSAEAAESNDVEMAQADDTDETTENEKKDQTEQQKNDDDDDEGDNEIVAKVDKSQELKKTTEELTETEKKTLDEKLSETNGEIKNLNENSTELELLIEEESCIVAAVTDKEVAAEILASEIDMNNEKSNISKMDVDEIPADDTEVVAAVIGTDTEANDVVAADSAAAIVTESDDNNVTKNKTNNSDTSTTTTTTTTISATDNAADTKNNAEEGNGIITGKLPVDIPNSTDTTANDTTTAANASAESALDGDIDIETAVLTTTNTTNTIATTETTTIIDDVALLKAAVTADPTEISAAEENDILSEPMEGIVDDEDTSKVDTTVECSLFKKSLLGNGNSNTTALVATGEMAN